MIQPPMTILVVEDDREVREVAIAALETDGFRVFDAASGEEALRLLVSHPELRIDAVFTDVVMPGAIDGVDLADAIRRLRPELPVLFTTGFADLARRHRTLESLGPVLRKPYRPSELRRALLALVNDTVD
jgi:CheY-like chemotaxis protein